MHAGRLVECSEPHGNANTLPRARATGGYLSSLYSLRLSLPSFSNHHSLSDPSSLLLASSLPPFSVSALLQVIALAIPPHRPSALTLSLASGFSSVILFLFRLLAFSFSSLFLNFLPDHPHHLHILLALAIHPYLALICVEHITDLERSIPGNKTHQASRGKAQ